MGMISIDIFLIFVISIYTFAGSTSFQDDDDLEGEAAVQLNVKQSATDNLLFDARKTLIWGPGLSPSEIVLPARYFFVHFVNFSGGRLNSSELLKDDFKVRIDCGGLQLWSQVLDRKDGSFIVRYKVFQSCLSELRIIVTWGNNVQLGNSPYVIKEPVHPDTCNCPKYDVRSWQLKVGCQSDTLPEQLRNDLRPFLDESIEFDSVLNEVKERFGPHSGSYSFCHYAIKDNRIYRKCYGQHVGFHIFPDSVLLSLTRKMYFPDLEFIMNLGDWPLAEKKPDKPIIPIFSWCKSNATYDILLPTYEITEASLEGMGRVSLDMMTVQSNAEKAWGDKIPKLFWRGRDSRQERLDLIKLGKKYPDLFNVSLTNFFFFRDKEHIYGPKTPHVSFFKFFDYKYQLSIDGTVAAYRFPYLLGGDSVVLKSDSIYIEHFYSDLKPWIHYIPVAANLNDLVNQVKWAQNNDQKAQNIGGQGRLYAQEKLMPLDILCYHTTVYNEWAKRLQDPITIRPDMELVDQPSISKLRPPVVCNCRMEPKMSWVGEEKDEL